MRRSLFNVIIVHSTLHKLSTKQSLQTAGEECFSDTHACSETAAKDYPIHCRALSTPPVVATAVDTGTVESVDTEMVDNVFSEYYDLRKSKWLPSQKI